MLMRENAGLVSNSVTAEHLLNGWRRISAPEMTRLEPELGMRGKKGLVSSGVAAARSSCGESMSVPETIQGKSEDGPVGNHDISYAFTLPSSIPQVLAWARLLARVHRGELEP